MRSSKWLWLLFLPLCIFLLGSLSAEDAPRRDMLGVEFKEINEKGYPIVILKNKTGKDIDTIRGAFIVETKQGDTVAATGQTNAVPGQLLLAAGKSIEMAPFGFNRKEGLMETLRTNPDSLRFFFELHDVTYLE